MLYIVENHRFQLIHGVSGVSLKRLENMIKSYRREHKFYIFASLCPNEGIVIKTGILYERCVCSHGVSACGVLAATGLLPREEIRTTTEDVMQRLRDACAAGQLYVPHFQSLLDLPDADAVLSEVAAHTSRYFPFNYH